MFFQANNEYKQKLFNIYKSQVEDNELRKKKWKKPKNWRREKIFRKFSTNRKRKTKQNTIK